MNVIVAVDQNWAIGKDGDQLVYLSEDLKRFKSLTTGHPVILGRKTLATFPGGRPLKGRRTGLSGPTQFNSISRANQSRQRLGTSTIPVWHTIPRFDLDRDQID